jgi:hypothetical protein
MLRLLEGQVESSIERIVGAELDEEDDELELLEVEADEEDELDEMVEDEEGAGDDEAEED